MTTLVILGSTVAACAIVTVHGGDSIRREGQIVRSENKDAPTFLPGRWGTVVEAGRSWTIA